MSDVEFLIDENILGVSKHLEVTDVKFRKVGDENCVPLESSDSIVAQSAKDNNLIVVTNDQMLKEQCEIIGVKCMMPSLLDFSKTLIDYAKEN